MTIEYLIAMEDGTIVSKGEFSTEDRDAQRRFAIRAKEAWSDGHAVITKAKGA